MKGVPASPALPTHPVPTSSGLPPARPVRMKKSSRSEAYLHSMRLDPSFLTSCPECNGE